MVAPTAASLLVLPCSLLLLITSLATPAFSQDVNANAEANANRDAPRDLPHDVGFFPEHDAVVRRSLALHERLQKERPVAIRKMSSDPGEKFYWDYWLFADDVGGTNQTLLTALESAFLFHSDYDDDRDRDRDRDDSGSAFLPRLLDPRRLSLFSKRDFQCPTGTYACTSIKRPNSCCSTDSTCQLVPNTGLGDVGCCPAGETCGGDLASCRSDYSSCNGGGCCLPGYACMGVGCVQTNTSTVVVAPSTTQAQASTVTVTSTVWTTPSAGSPVVHTSTYVTIIIPPVATSPTTTTTTSSTSSACSTDQRSCPASLGGGCCHTTLACGTSKQCLPTSYTTRASQPVLPIPGPSSSSTFSLSGCPTGFYACSAYYEGGCCQVDRDCHTTSCPTRASTTLVDTNSITAVAPTGSGITAPGNLQTGSCASYWTLCGADVSGGCCPTGYACGVSACTATETAGQGNTVAKEAPNGTAWGGRVDWVVLAVGLCLSSVAFGSAIWL